jgi:hypothetical protein
MEEGEEEEGQVKVVLKESHKWRVSIAGIRRLPVVFIRPIHDQEVCLCE